MIPNMGSKVFNGFCIKSFVRLVFSKILKLIPGHSGKMGKIFTYENGNSARRNDNRFFILTKYDYSGAQILRRIPKIALDLYFRFQRSPSDSNLD